MTHSRPSLLFGKGLGGSQLDKGFEACPTQAQWIGNNYDPYKRLLTNNLRDYLQGVDGQLFNSDNGHVLARMMLTEVRGHWNELVSFIDSFYQEGVRVFGFNHIGYKTIEDYGNTQFFSPREHGCNNHQLHIYFRLPHIRNLFHHFSPFSIHILV